MARNVPSCLFEWPKAAPDRECRPCPVTRSTGRPEAEPERRKTRGTATQPLTDIQEFKREVRRDLGRLNARMDRLDQRFDRHLEGHP